MRTLFEFLKTTLVGGFFIVLPVGILGFLIVEAVGTLVALVSPAADRLDVDTIFGIDAALVAGALILAGLCFATGLVMRTRLGTDFGHWIERAVLDRVPGYGLIRTLTRRIAGTEESASFAPAMAQLQGDGAEALVFIVEAHANGDYTVFLPVSPTPTIGFVYVVPGERVRRIDASLAAAANCVMYWGIGAKDLTPARQPTQT